MRGLDQADAEEAEVHPTTAEALQAKVRQLRERKGRYEQLRDALEASGESQVVAD